MDFVTVFLMGVGLSMDAFAVAVSNGMEYPTLGRGRMVLTAATYGFFQGLMPLLGFGLGFSFQSAIESFDHWIAFGLLAFLGGRMLWEAVGRLRRPETAALEVKPFSFQLLLAQGVATSIDALAVGVSLAAVQADIWSSVALIAATTFCLSLIGVSAGRRLGGMLSQKAEIAGGLILIGIGLRILVEHLISGI